MAEAKTVAVAVIPLKGVTTLQKKFRCYNLFKGVNLIETEANIVNVKTTNFYQRSI